MTPDPVFVLAAPGGYPDANRYKQWLQDLKSQTKFYALKQVLRKNYSGKAFSTETLANRFYNTKQYYYDKVARKTVIHSVQEFHAKLWPIKASQNLMLSSITILLLNYMGRKVWFS
jgi:hypothetical protein